MYYIIQVKEFDGWTYYRSASDYRKASDIEEELRAWHKRMGWRKDTRVVMVEE